MSHRDYSWATIARRPGHDDEAILEIACRDVSELAVVTTIIAECVLVAEKHLLCVCKVEALLGERASTLALVPRDLI
jgi:hypothetical protein